jgi:hypothetical protein
MRLHLEPFDPSRDFVCLAPFRAGGHAWGRKQPFDRALVNERTLRLLYESHKIGYADGPDPIRNHDVAKPLRALQVGPLGDGDRAPAGDAPTATGEGAVGAPEHAQRLADRHRRAELVELAQGAGLTVGRDTNKLQIATALVEAGHGTA